MADRPRRLPARARLAHRRHHRHRAAELDRGPDPGPRHGAAFLLKDPDHDFAAARNASVLERDAAVDAARSGLTREEQQVFDAGLASNRAVNFPWWQDEHAFYIDLRVALPMRWASLEIAARVGADRPDDTMYLFWPELPTSPGAALRAGLRSLVEQREQYFDYWLQRPASPAQGARHRPGAVADPILIEVFGINGHLLGRCSGDADARRDADRDRRRQGHGRGDRPGPVQQRRAAPALPGDVLVCESTSPNWTPAFGKIAACVCDGGGTLSHAAIVGREYGIPTVTAVGIVTIVIPTATRSRSTAPRAVSPSSSGRPSWREHRSGDAARYRLGGRGRPDEAVSVCGAKMGRLAELLRAGVSLPRGSPSRSRRSGGTGITRAWTRWPTPRWAGSAPRPGPPRSKRPPAPSGPNWPAGTSAPTWPR